MMKSKAVWWTTGIFAVIGITQGIGGFIGGALGGFGISASWVLIFKGLSKANYKRKQMAEERAQIPKEVLQKKKEEKKKKKEEKARIKAEKKAQAQAVIQQLQKAKMKCPRCGSTNIQLSGKHRDGFSVGKAVGGAVLTGGIGALAGFAGKQTKKSDWVCLDCGKAFTIK